MKYFPFIVFSSIFIFSSCELYNHTNPLDPNNPTIKKGSNANFKITEYTLSDGYENDKGLSVTIINNGKGSTEGEITGNISTTDNSVNFVAPLEQYVHKDSQSKYPLTISPNDVLEGGYFMTVTSSKSKPYDICFLIKFTDGYGNTCCDSLVVTFNN
ncbi:MAG: hypothetical protein P4L35_11295 [Ignavibacteriaceae bacterium]|nr:hypothetical protein [Ignavibacteriaceae bacterium]